MEQIESFESIAGAVRSAGESSITNAELFDQYSPILDQADADIVYVQSAVITSRSALPGIQQEIENASSNLSATGDSLDNAGAAVQELSDSPAIPRIAIFSLVFLGTMNVLLALGGLAALAAARSVQRA